MPHHGTPTAGRFASARRSRERTQKSLAAELGLSAQFVSLVERGERPGDALVDACARVLRFPRQYFYEPEMEDLQPDAVTFRSRRSLTARLRDAVLEHARHASDLLTPALESRFAYPTADIPDISESGGDPEIAARLVRDGWGIGPGPLVNVVHLLEARGVHVYWLNKESACVDALSFWRHDRPFVLLNRFKEAGERGRFDAAHELGHLVMHRHVRHLEQVHEQEADRFASAFLMPREQFLSEAYPGASMESLLRLKTRWGVSLQAMLRRLFDLGAMSRWQYESSFRVLSARGWRTAEPGRLSREQSHAHLVVFTYLRQEGLGPKALAESCSLPLDEIMQLMPIGEWFDLNNGGSASDEPLLSKN